MQRVLRHIGVVVLLVLTAILLLASPRERIPDDGRTYIRYWYIVGATDNVPYHARAFNEAQDSIRVLPTPIPWQEHEKKILTAVLSGDPPDVVSQFVPVVKWASRMALTPLDPFIERDAFDPDIFFPALWDEMQWQGRAFGLPVNSVSYALLYSRTLFEEAGLDPDRPPRTWEEVQEYARKLTRRDARGRLVQMGFVPHYGNVHAAALKAWQRDVTFLSEDGTRVNMTHPEFVRALEWCVDMVSEYGFRDVTAFVSGFGVGEQHGFLSGKLGMMVLDMSFLNLIERYRPDMDYGVALVPSDEGRPTASASGSWWLAIPRGARQPEAAWEFIKFATEKDVQLQEVLSTTENLFPSNRLAAYDTTFIKDAETEIFVSQMDYAHSPAVVPMAHDVFWREFYSAQERAIYGRQPAMTALAQAEGVVQRALDAALEYDAYVRSRMDFNAGEHADAP